MASYQWKRGKFPVAAQVAGEHLQQIQEEEGVITPSIIVDRNRDEDAPLHRCFDWNDKTAAEEYRKVQAREILRFIVVTKEDADEEEAEPMRAFLHVQVTKKEDEGEEEDNCKSNVYLSTESVMNDEEYRQFVLKDALSWMAAFRRKYAHLSELSAVITAMDEFERQLVKA